MSSISGDNNMSGKYITLHVLRDVLKWVMNVTIKSEDFIDRGVAGGELETRRIKKEWRRKLRLTK